MPLIPGPSRWPEQMSSSSAAPSCWATPRVLSSPVGNTGYTESMAKVMVSLPDDLLRAVDIEAERRGTSRSGLLRALAEETLHRGSIRRAERMAQIDDLHGSITGHGGGVAELVKANRPEG
jgi:hypothetical protein